ncbi:MAG: hypothetical protein RBU45_23100, partial [Myxococcota bacterium]|nr:hypothetical protein [Myxococcota bacterium]
MSDTPPRLPGLPLQPGTAPRLQGPLLRAATLRLSWAQPRRFSWDDGSATPVSGRVPILRPRSRWLPLGLASLLLLGVGLGLLLIHQDRAGWPGLASRRGLYVAADEVWTGRREPIWIRTALPGPVLSAAPSRKHDRAAEVLALHTLAQRQGLDLSWVTWQSAAAPSSPGEWLRFKEQEEVIPQPALWVARSLAQQLVLPAPAPAAAARPRAARRGRRPRPAVTAGIPGTPRLLVFGSDLPLTGPLPAEGVFRLAHLLQGRVALLGPFPSLAEPSPLLSLRGYDGLAVFAGPDPAGPDPADPPTSGDAFYRWLVSFGGGAQRVAALAGSSGDAAAVDEAAPYTLALVSSADVDGLREAVDRRQTVAVRG